MKCLIHEEVWEDDPWRVLATCIMLNCTTEEKARPVVAEFFKRWPTAKTSFLGNIEEQVKLLAPLGFHGKKADNIKKTSKTFATWAMIHPTKVKELVVTNCAGCGQYAQDAWDLIVLNIRDRPLKNKELERRRLELLHG